MTGTMQLDIILGILKVLAFVPAIVIHECAHGFAAYKLGDPTAKRGVRLTLNPLKHVDPFGTVVIPGLLILSGAGFVFGYAKPVPYNPGYFKDIRKGEVIVGLAGPASNIAMSAIGAAIAWAAVMWGDASMAALYVWYFGTYFCTVNLCLAFFNLIPIPPLDGSSIIAPLLSDRALATYYKVQQYGMFILLVLIIAIPYLFPQIDILSWYLQATAGNLSALMLPI